MKRKILIFITALFLFNFFSCSNNSQAKKNTTPDQVVTQDNNNNTTADQTIQTTSDPDSSVASTSQNTSSNPWAKIDPTKVNRINTQQFKDLVFDYTKSQTWNYKGDKPCVIDFYADWCRPCRYVSPIMEELAKEYNGQIYFYKINVDYEKEVASVFGIRSIPSVLFCPVKGQPRMAVGAMQKEAYMQAIKDILGIDPPSSK